MSTGEKFELGKNFDFCSKHISDLIINEENCSGIKPQ
jgi:hypothetical protein